ncbi:MAG: OmpA family protein [Hyphomicrobium sp.]
MPKRSAICTFFGRAGCLCLLMVAAVLVGVPQASRAEDGVTSDQIHDALTRPRRGGAANAAVASETIERLKAIGHRRGLNLQEREELAQATSGLPQIDLTIYFDFDSAQLTATARPHLRELGAALSRADLKGATIVLSGHTDARGGPEYNQGLSERRADAVAKFLVDEFGLEPKSLLATGYGAEQLLNQADPKAAENRRVQIVNAGR